MGGELLSPITGGVTLLYETPRAKRMGKNTIVDLQDLLESMDSGTLPTTLADPLDLKLDDNARTLRGGYRLTETAFVQIAQILGPGVSKLLPDVAGMAMKPMELSDAGLAISMWNRLLELRFNLLRKYRVIRNDQSMFIEGIAGNRYEYLNNCTLYKDVLEVMKENSETAEPFSAMLVGRRFSLWLRRPTPEVFTPELEDMGRWPIHGGYYFTNGESTGVSVRATAVVYMPRGICLAPYRKYGGMVSHTGKNFQQRVAALLSRVCDAYPDYDKISEGVAAMDKAPLGFASDDAKGTRRKKERKIVDFLYSSGIPKNLANEIVRLALNVGRHNDADRSSGSHQQAKVFAARKQLDLFIAIQAVSKKLDQSMREKLEQVAFMIATAPETLRGGK